MITGLFDTEDEQSKRKFYAELKTLKPGAYAYSIKKNKPIRSLGANKYFHMVWNIYATHTGHYIDELKREFYDKIGFYELFTDKRGKQTKRYKSSKDCDTTEMSSLINQQAQWGRDEFPEVIVPRKEDATYLQWIQVENEYNRTFSGW
jgi:hypothetical protein